MRSGAIFTTMFNGILEIINNSKSKNFYDTCKELEACINTDGDFINTLRQIGVIPEAITHDSTEEKLFAKASDIVLSRTFRELGLKSTVLNERADSADVIAESKIHGYTLVADAKAFRLSRTAKNQKDFKVSALSSWRKDNDFAVLCSPYFQYPARISQIYAQALTHNVCLFSWEHLIFMIENGIVENENLNLSEIWSFCDKFSRQVLVSDMKNNFLPELNNFLSDFLNIDKEIFNASLNTQIISIIERSNHEKTYWNEEIRRIKNYSRQKAIDELIASRRIYEKLNQINTYVNNILQ